MKTRILSAAIALPLFLAVLLVPVTWPTALLLAAMCAIGARELLWATGLVPHKRLVAYAMICGALVCLWSYLGCPRWLGLAGVTAFFLAQAGELLSAHAKLSFSEIAAMAFAGLLVPLLLSALVRIRCMDHGAALIFMPLVLAFTSDSGAYFAGRAFGKHKLAPVISPKKTVEGAIGGVASTVLFVLLYGLVLQLACGFQVHYWAGLVYGIAGAVCGMVGDLMFSVVKRQAGIKDYGNVLPGHGGVLDRFDSMVAVAPVAELLLLVLPFAVK